MAPRSGSACRAPGHGVVVEQVGQHPAQRAPLAPAGERMVVEDAVQGGRIEPVRQAETKLAKLGSEWIIIKPTPTPIIRRPRLSAGRTHKSAAPDQPIAHPSSIRPPAIQQQPGITSGRRAQPSFSTPSARCETCGHKNLKRKISQKYRIIFSY